MRLGPLDALLPLLSMELLLAALDRGSDAGVAGSGLHRRRRSRWTLNDGVRVAEVVAVGVRVSLIARYRGIGRHVPGGCRIVERCDRGILGLGCPVSDVPEIAAEIGAVVRSRPRDVAAAAQTAGAEGEIRRDEDVHGHTGGRIWPVVGHGEGV